MFLKILIMVCWVASSAYVQASEQKRPPDCDHITSWEQSDADEVRLLRINHSNISTLKRYPRPKAPNNTMYKMEHNANRTAYFLEPGLKYSKLFVVTANGKTLKLDVPEWTYRPLEAQWLTNNLLKIKMSFNPHAGIYWIFDVNRKRMASSQHWLEDVYLMAKCDESAEE
jgi:hypothetical protein